MTFPFAIPAEVSPATTLEVVYKFWISTDEPIKSKSFCDKVIFLRLDLNVPFDGTKITDDTRIRESLPTIRYALENGA
ncbi:MAG: phosphoglycerate kinase, partial [Pedobacter sp.]